MRHAGCAHARLRHATRLLRATHPRPHKLCTIESSKSRLPPAVGGHVTGLCAATCAVVTGVAARMGRSHHTRARCPTSCHAQPTYVARRCAQPARYECAAHQRAHARVYITTHPPPMRKGKWALARPPPATQARHLVVPSACTWRLCAPRSTTTNGARAGSGRLLRMATTGSESACNSCTDNDTTMGGAAGHTRVP